MTTDSVCSFSGNRVVRPSLGSVLPAQWQLLASRTMRAVYPFPKVCARATWSSVADVTHSNKLGASDADGTANAIDEID